MGKRTVKKAVAAIVGLLLLLFMCSCSSSENKAGSTYTVNKYGTDYIVNSADGTISDGQYTYQYEISAGSNNYSIHITYPDGSTYRWNAQSNGGVTAGSGGGSADYDAARYADGQTLCDILEEKMPGEKGSENILLTFLLFAVGIFNTLWPHAAWYLEYGWRYKNAEPSDLVLGLNRFGGIIAIIVAVIVAFI